MKRTIMKDNRVGGGAKVTTDKEILRITGVTYARSTNRH